MYWVTISEQRMYRQELIWLKLTRLKLTRQNRCFKQSLSTCRLVLRSPDLFDTLAREADLQVLIAMLKTCKFCH